MAASYGYPGVYIEERPSGSMPIQGVGTSVAAFVGFTQGYYPQPDEVGDPSGTRPQLVTSWPEFERRYGSFTPGAMLPYAVRGFFDNGGSACYIVRTPTPAQEQPAALELSAADRPELQSLHVEAVERGTASHEIEIVAPPPPAEGQAPSEGYRLRVFTNGELREELTGLDFTKSARTLEKTLNDQARHVRVTVPPGPAGVSLTERAPAPGRYALVDPAPQSADPGLLEGSVNERTGYQGLAIADNVTIVAVPDLVTVATGDDGTFDEALYLGFQGQLVDWCAASGKRMAILDPPPKMSATQAADWRARLSKDSPFATCYYPNVLVPNRTAPPGATDGQRFLTVPPSGHIAGAWARTDAERGVWKAPANTELRGITALETTVTDGEQTELNPIGVNCLRSFGVSGMRIWGARTISVTDQSWRYINVRRLFCFVEESIRRGTQWAVFEPNGPDLWQRVKRNVSAFLRGLWMQGALVGATPAQAFYVLCDETNNPPSSVDEGKLVVEIGLAAVKPAEFVIFRIGQWDGGAATSE
jgi:phage tail sheath protein FI